MEVLWGVGGLVGEEVPSQGRRKIKNLTELQPDMGK